MRLFAVAAALATLFALTSSNVAATDVDASTIRVVSGALHGVVTSGIATFKGIPYAAPPIGALRWRAPQPPLRWAGVRDARDFGLSCEQAPPPRFVAPESRSAGVSEDCLTLNVWTPVVRASPLPVMVWLHGGGNLYGTGSTTIFDGTAFARDGVVLVTINYRLGLFGFFAHPALDVDDAEAADGNFALLDQIAALRWVRANIAAFGGDANDVTLFGESEGARDTMLLATSNVTKGLFSRAIAESPNALWSPLPSRSAAAAHGVELASQLGLSRNTARASDLRAVPAAALAALANRDRIGPIAGEFPIEGPGAAAYEGVPHVPILIGTNDDDGGVGEPLPDADSVFPELSRDEVASIRAKYAARGIAGDAAVARTLYGDGTFAAPARWVATRAATSGTVAYLYRFSYVSRTLEKRGVVAAPHGSDVPYVFETGGGRLDDDDRAMQAILHGCWVAFAKTGKPADVSGTSWAAFDPASPRVMVFDAHPSMRPEADGDVMDLLERRMLPT